MSAEYDIGLNLVSAAIGAAAGAGWAYSAKRWRYRRHRAFWRFLQKPTAFVAGDLKTYTLLGTLSKALEEVITQPGDRRLLLEKIISHVDSQEVSGLIGRGDLESIVNMVLKFASFRLPIDMLIVEPVQAREYQTHNLVVIGGKDVNPLAEDLTSRMGCQLEPLTNEEGHNVVRDHRLKVDHPVTWQNEPDANGEIHRVDYGILTRGRHPDDDNREVLLLAGAHGLGTLAAAQISVDSKFAKRLCSYLKEYGGNFECLVSYRRIEGGPSDGRAWCNLEFSRGLDMPIAN